jgi:hypothetical protein
MQIVIVAIAAVVLATLAALGVYAAGKPAATQIDRPIISYGSR